MNWSLPALAIRRPVTMVMITVTMLCLGGIALYLTPIEFIPRVDVPILACYIPYPGATPPQVETEVAIPAEGEFRTLSGLQRITTYSSGDGCNVVMRFGWDTNMTLAAVDLRDRIERLKLKLPPEIDRLLIRRYYSDQEPVIRFALFREENQAELARAVRSTLKNRLMRIDGVADVQVSGREEEEVYVEFDQHALRSLNLGLYQVVSVLQSSSLNVGAGTLLDGNTKFFVRTEGEFSTPEELGDVVLTPGGIRLKDVAKITVREPDGAGSFMIDGKRGVFVSVQRESEANTVEVCDAVHAELEQIKQDPLFRGVELFVFDDQGEIVRFAIGALTKAGEFGSLLAFTVLLLCLRRLRPTIIVALSTPASLVAAFIYMYFSGQSLNLVTMSALLVSLGMLVDNAIVVIENIQRHNRLGPDRRLNAERGASEVALAITASTFTTIVVFIPVMYMEAGELSLFMKEFAGPMGCALLTSLVLALTILPLAESRMGNRGLGFAEERPKSRNLFLRMIRAIQPIEWSKSLYRDLMIQVLRRRTISLGLLGALLFATYWVPFRNVGVQQMPSMDMREVVVRFYADPNYGIEGVKETVEHIVSTLDGKRKELGIKNIYLDQWATGAFFRAYLLKAEDLQPGETFPYETNEVRDILSELLPRNVPGGRIDCGVSSAAPTEEATVSLRMLGDDTDTLYRYAEEFERLMASRPELSEAKAHRDESKEEIQIEIDEARSAEAGATPSVIAQTVGFALRGNRLPFMKKEGREISVWAQFQGENRRTKADLENVAVQGEGGELYSLNQLVTMHRAPMAQGVYRENGKTVVTLTGKTLEDDLTQVRRELTTLVDNFEMPRGYTLTLGDELKNVDENLRNFRGAIVMSIVLIYLVMAALFESALLPLSILTSVLLAFVGVYWSMYLTDTPMDTIALICSILMCGVIVNNGIVIVDHVNQLRKHGVDRFQAIITAGQDRFRPVLMTASTTILGCLPMAIGGGETASALHSVGRAFVGGLSAGTLLTLLVVPLAYTIVDDLQAWCVSFFGGLASLNHAKASRNELP